jgi:hypothetical protein
MKKQHEAEKVAQAPLEAHLKAGAPSWKTPKTAKSSRQFDATWQPDYAPTGGGKFSGKLWGMSFPLSGMTSW